MSEHPLETYLNSYLEFAGDVMSPSGLQKVRDGLAVALVAHDREKQAEALEQFAAILRERYPEDVFRPLSDKDHRSVNDALAGRIERTHITRDAVSADMMRRAAVQADEEAAEYRNTGNTEGTN